MAFWGGVICCVSAASLFAFGWYRGREAEALKSVTRVKSLKDLSWLLDTDSKFSRSIVTISGRVGSKTPIRCRYSDIRGVIVEETAEQSFLKQNDVGQWIKESEILFSTRKKVPWYLDDGTGRAFVYGARGASGFVLNVGREVFEEAAGESSHRDLQMLGVKRVESVLPIGTRLTVVGEVFKDRVGKIRFQRPSNGPFYVSRKSIDQLIKDLGEHARWCKIVAMGFTFLGVFLLVKHSYPYIALRVRRWQWRRRVAAMISEQKNEGSTVKKENGTDGKNDLLTTDLCVICMEQEYNSVFVQCGHMCCCMTCSSLLTECPLCRRRIKQVVRTFRH